MSFMKRRGRFADEEPLAEINVTPFVDVVLVLLIIFMITAAVVEFGMRVGVPPTTTATASRPSKPNVVQIASNGRLFYDGSEVNIYAIPERAKGANAKAPEIYLQIHKLASYDIVAQVLAECRAQGVEVNLVSRPLTRNPS
jgi:biopolymer transport protein ExbD